MEGDRRCELGTSLLRLLALATIPGMINTLYVNVARVRRTMKVVVAVMGIQSVLVLALTWWFFSLFGLLGVGIAWIETLWLETVIFSKVLLPPIARA